MNCLCECGIFLSVGNWNPSNQSNRGNLANRIMHPCINHQVQTTRSPWVGWTLSPLNYHAPWSMTNRINYTILSCFCLAFKLKTPENVYQKRYSKDGWLYDILHIPSKLRYFTLIIISISKYTCASTLQKKVYIYASCLRPSMWYIHYQANQPWWTFRYNHDA